MAIWNERIKNLRNQKGITLARIAEGLGVTEATAQRYESGSIKNIPYEHICSYAKLLGCTPSYLMGFTDIEKENPVYFEITEKSLTNNPELLDTICGIMESLISLPESPFTAVIDLYKSVLSFIKNNNVDLRNKAVVLNQIIELVSWNSQKSINIKFCDTDKLNKKYISSIISGTKPQTVAAHFDGAEYSEAELEEIKQFAEFVKNKRK